MKNSVHAVLLSIRPWRTENSVTLVFFSVRADGNNIHGFVVCSIQ